MTTKLSRVDDGRPSSKSTTVEHEAPRHRELAARDRVHQAQKKHLTRWLTEMAASFRHAPIVVREANLRRLHVTKRARPSKAPGMRAPTSSPSASEQDH